MNPELRLDSLVVENFRSISGRWTIPLDAQTILIHGPNGAGKTSLVSALELAATGDVGFLADADVPLQEVLLHREWPLGEVELRLREKTGAPRIGKYRLDHSGLVGEPALTEAQRAVFLERSFLPQTALGMLLKTYTSSTKDVETSLVRFVKTLVGLDEIDNLIEGLEALGHLSRAKSLSAEWSAADRELVALSADESDLREQSAAAQREAANAIAGLRDLDASRWAEVPDSELAVAALTRVRQSELAGDSAKGLEGLRLRLDGIAAVIDIESARMRPGSGAEVAALTISATMELEAWEAGEGAAGLIELNDVRRTIALDEVSMSALVDAFSETQLSLEQRRAAAAELADRRDQLVEQIAGRKDALVTTDREIEATTLELTRSDVPDDLHDLIAVLTQASTLTTSNVCPVCDQGYAGTASTLAEHVTEKLGQITSAAARLVAAQKRLAEMAETRREHERQLVALEGQPVPTVPDTDFRSLGRRLNSLESAVHRGEKLRRRVQSSQARSADLTARESALAVASARLDDVRGLLGAEDLALELGENLQRISALLDARVQKAQFEATRHERAKTVARRLDEASAKRDAIDARLATATARVRAVRDRVREAERRKKSANGLRLEAQRVRSEVINEVFDGTLNSLWADLFGRFAPSEPFVPQFEKQTHTGRGRSRTVDVKLETALPDGSRAAAPSSVLSFGNANTAALSLFLALHLSARDTLPWLIFDDPVQSMDDIHISNFAAVVRQLTGAHDRQVVIAVHQRELFEYLALELAPSAPEQSLVKVTLDRHLDVSHIGVERVEYAPEPSLLASGLE